jgi:hypothetical protein
MIHVATYIVNVLQFVKKYIPGQGGSILFS